MKSPSPFSLWKKVGDIAESLIVPGKRKVKLPERLNAGDASSAGYIDWTSGAEDADGNTESEGEKLETETSTLRWKSWQMKTE